MADAPRLSRHPKQAEKIPGGRQRRKRSRTSTGERMRPSCLIHRGATVRTHQSEPAGLNGIRNRDDGDDEHPLAGMFDVLIGERRRIDVDEALARPAVYVRVSTLGQTTANQERELREVATRMGCEIVHVYRDHGVSGAMGRDKRPQFDKLCSGTRPNDSLMLSWHGRSTGLAARCRTWSAS
jgi:Resolvase, N terminal domain